MTNRTRLAIGAGLAIAIGLGGLLLSDADTPEVVSDLERAQEESEKARSNSERITERLRAIAENLAEGEDLSGQSDSIGRLTERQRESLEELVGILEGQLDALERSAGSLAGTQTSTDTVADLSETQARLLRRAVASLRRLEAAAKRASAFSADVATRARYAARLAEDSQESFSGDP
ncbi:MAG: hypothetical protein ACRDLB_13930 [Actinomycetota bacterium]